MTRAWDVQKAGDLPERPGPGRVRLAAVQMNPRIGDVEGNLQTCLSAATAAAGLGAGLVVFPECCLTGYCFADREEALAHALTREHPALARLAEASTRLGCRLVVGYLEKEAHPSLFNAVSIVGPAGIEVHYRKTHLPHLGADRWVTPGCELSVHEVAGLRLGLLICYDASFPEATRALALAGADLVLLPTNWPQEAEIKADWLPNTRAYENVIYFAAVNRTGIEREFAFHGKSRLCGPAGETLVQGPADRECLLLADVDPARARQKRIERRAGYWVDRIGDRRVDLYRLAFDDAFHDSMPREGERER